MTAMSRRFVWASVRLGVITALLSTRSLAQPSVTAITGATLIDGTGGAAGR